MESIAKSFTLTMVYQLNIVIIVIIGCCGGVNGKSTRVCVNNSINFPPANLSCNEGQMIHVQSISYNNDVNKCEDHLNNTRLCDQPLNESSLRLVTDCNGHRTCNLTRSSCSGNLDAVVKYRCINSTDVLHICEKIKWPTSSQNRKTVLLASPNYPQQANFDTQPSPCSCWITGHNITSIQVLELTLKGGKDEKAVFTIEYGDKTYNTSSFIREYNVLLQTSTTNAAFIRIIHRKFPNSKIWIEFIGNSLSAECNNATTNAWKPTTAPTMRSTINEGTSGSVASSAFPNNRPIVTQTILTTLKSHVSTGGLSSVSTSNGTSWMDNDDLPSNTESTLIIVGPIVGLIVVAVIIIISFRMKKRKSTKLQHAVGEHQNAITHLMEPSTAADLTHPTGDINTQTDIIIDENTAYVSYAWSSSGYESSDATVEILENTEYVPFEKATSGN